jgi:hypothetical protein
MTTEEASAVVRSIGEQTRHGHGRVTKIAGRLDSRRTGLATSGHTIETGSTHVETRLPMSGTIAGRTADAPFGKAGLPG